MDCSILSTRHLPNAPRQWTPACDKAPALVERFLHRIADPAFPCVGSKAALARGTLRATAFGPLSCPQQARSVHAVLADFGAGLDALPDTDTRVHALAAVFSGPDVTDEDRFETLLFTFLQQLHDVDRSSGHPWAHDAASDPDHPQFSMSVASHPYFVIGLHPGASRHARRFEVPVLVFNSHRQFERLRSDGRYAKMQAATRARDRALQGSINPNLADFGTAPETRQYSGRAVEADWRCPLHIRTGTSR